MPKNLNHKTKIAIAFVAVVAMSFILFICTSDPLGFLLPLVFLILFFYDHFFKNDEDPMKKAICLICITVIVYMLIIAIAKDHTIYLSLFTLIIAPQLREYISDARARDKLEENNPKGNDPQDPPKP